ncbi:cation:proton antiporter [Candidatus Poribacteria bacterium]|nr:cation:proton antiporter [Candidatus Poribacteria bacterium]
MSHHDVVLFFLQISSMLAVALIFGQVMRRLHLPIVLGELIGGILLGPTVLGALAPNLYAWLFPTSGTTSLGRDAVIKLGMLFFLFVAGLEVDLAHLQRRGLSIACTSIAGILVPFGLGLGLVLLLPDPWGPQATSNVFMFALFIGTALSISALPVIARILIDLDLIKRELGMVVMAAATIDDLIGWLLFAVILSNFAPSGLPVRSLGVTLSLVLGLFALILSVGRWVGQRTLCWLQSRLSQPSGFIGVTAVLVLVVAATTEVIGLHAIWGAFLVGVALAENSEKRNQAHEMIYQFAISFFAPIYFVSIGLQANFAANFHLLLVLLILLVACVGKIGGVTFGAWMGKMSPRDALAIGFGMNARGAMGMVLASMALEYKLIDQRVFVALIVMALVTSLLSGPIMQRLLMIKPLDEGKSREGANGS